MPRVSKGKTARQNNLAKATAGQNSSIESPPAPNVKRCLDEVPQLFILRFSNRAVRFISGYYLGCTGKDLGYLQKEYKSHRMLPYNAVTLMKQSVQM
ncbi:hypothetical protein B0H16DRAFT_1580190 [Mycena metata]|uniref:Uncharacterized protein n=1 Tax=Mycena metata TaxID=1033252 RepID=A0AAD7I3F0_9AGAR|nr:hypothetical protein B0H16DRAFT_1580190 [Mycena metata]